ncbi:hypothetical protein AAV94_05935 [Lampropedia cohaerens]|uniref:FAD-binding domain-containing protein n=2 Tax=Lampropedia cohaerens TaxID=1610491 RepID=A0A0U1Q0T6_9BURK|nr:hypothetical protein AAV94_05935 [Lampropedia cohaerens]
MPNTGYDVCIRGAGIVGRALALRLGQAKLRVALVDQSVATTRPEAARDVRAYALNHASRHLLQQMRCWPEAAAATAVRHMRVYGDAGGAVHFDGDARATSASAPQDGPDDALAWIVDVPALEDMLAAALRFQPSVDIVTTPVEAPLTALCEGRDSASRTAVGVQFDVHDYPQHAVATRVRASQPHQGTAYQWFHGPHILALLPLDGPEGDGFAVVWSTDAAIAAELVTLTPEAFIARMAETIATASARHPMPATMADLTGWTTIAPRVRWPLRLAQARQWAGQMPDSASSSWVLLGDAAHNVHPLAGSGLNLGLGDVAALSDALLGRPQWRSVADMRLLRNYARQRKSALLPYAVATDGLQWLFWQDRPALEALRNWGMRGFSASGPLKQWVMRLAMSGAQP